MPPQGGKGKSKGREARRSRSRNTTPSSTGQAAALGTSTETGYLEIPISNIAVPSNITYDEILERHGGGTGIPDSRHLDTLTADLRTLAQLAETRSLACDRGMRELAKRRKERLEEERLKEREAEIEERKKEAAAEAEEESKGKSGGKLKKKKERPLATGAHGVARQDGLDTQNQVAMPKRKEKSKPGFVYMDEPGVLDRQNAELEELARDVANSWRPPIKDPAPAESSKPPKKGGSTPSKVKAETASTSMSSLSPSDRAQTPASTKAAEEAEDDESSESSSEDEGAKLHQPPPAPAVPQYQTFGPDPLTFDDPTVYHIRKVEPGMSEEEIKEIYSVATYPHDDLHDLIPGTPPDKDFSSAKPSTQVNANTFTTYIDPYLRPLTDEDMAWLKEKGDRVTPFIVPRRGKQHYTDIWAEEDGSISLDSSTSNRDKLPANQARGSMEQMTDEVAATEQLSTGPVLTRLLAMMRPEHRATPEDKATTNGVVNGEGESSKLADGDGIHDVEMNGDVDKPDPLPPAAFIPESAQPGWKTPNVKMDHAQVDERLKAELRHIGFLRLDQEPDYDAHYDDEIAARLRYLQSELKKQSIVNGARKARIAQLAQQHMAYQEFATIRDDLDNQVQQSYLKRNRTLGKGKKHAKKPGGAGGGSHYVGSAGAARPGIGDVAKTLMERRKKWMDSIGPVFDDDINRVPGTNDSIFSDDAMIPLMEKEKREWDEQEE